MAYESIIILHVTHKNKNSKFLPPQLTGLAGVHNCESLHNLDIISVFSEALRHPANYKNEVFNIAAHVIVTNFPLHMKHNFQLYSKGYIYRYIYYIYIYICKRI